MLIHKICKYLTIRAYESFVEVDPYRPVFFAENYFDRHSLGADIIAPDIYPIVRADNLDRSLYPMEEIAWKFRQFEYLPVTRGRASWFVPQAFGGYSLVGVPTPEQLKAMTFGAIACGANGIIWYAWSTPETSKDLAYHADLRKGVYELAGVLRDYSPMLLSDPSPAMVSLEPSLPDFPHRMWRYDGHDYLLAVNWQPFVIACTLRCSDDRSVVGDRVVGVGGDITFIDGQTHLRLEPLEYALWRIPIYNTQR